MKKIRFATQTGGAPSADEWFARAKRIEAMGYDTLAMPDHMVGGAWAAMPVLAALVPVTTKLRYGTLVMDNDFRNPVVSWWSAGPPPRRRRFGRGSPGQRAPRRALAT